MVRAILFSAIAVLGVSFYALGGTAKAVRQGGCDCCPICIEKGCGACPECASGNCPMCADCNACCNSCCKVK